MKQKILPALACALALSLMLPAASARACSSCQCGDPTLTIMGQEKPFAGRLRIAAEYRFRTEKVGIAGLNREELSEHRTTLSAAWTPIERLTLGLSVPLVGKVLDHTNLARERTFFVGDIELHARGLLWRDRETVPRHLVGVIAGIRMPSAPELDDAAGTALPLDVQPGTGAWTGSAGLYYGFFAHPFSLYASSFSVLSTEGFASHQAGNAWLNSVQLQWALDFPLALQLGFDARAAAGDTHGGVPDGNSGGFVGFVTPGIVYSPAEDLVLSVRVLVPVVDDLNGFHDEGPSILAGVVYDL